MKELSGTIASFFIIASLILEIIPKKEDKKYARFLLGSLFLLLMIRPFLTLEKGNELEKTVVKHSLTSFYKEWLKENQIEDKKRRIYGETYGKHVWEQEVLQQMKGYFSGSGYQVKKCNVSFQEQENWTVEQIIICLKKEEEGKEEELKEKIEELKKILGDKLVIQIEE